MKPSGARLAVSGRVTRTALKDTPHEGLVAGTSEDGKVFVWRADDGELLHTFELPLVRETVSKIALPSPRAVTLGRLDDRTIVAATTSRTARAWEVGSGDPIADLTWDANPHDRAAVAIIDSAILIAHMTEEDRVEVVDVLADVTRFRTRAYEHLSAIEFLRSEECGTFVALSSDDVIEILDVQEVNRRWPAVKTRSTPWWRSVGSAAWMFWPSRVRRASACGTCPKNALLSGRPPHWRLERPRLRKCRRPVTF